MIGKRQMLLNLLKVRYADALIFLDIASVINSYELAGDVSLKGQYGPPRAGNTWGVLGVTGRYSDKPTTTYQPVAGEEFTWTASTGFRTPLAARVGRRQAIRSFVNG
jgi:hypothetical protein